MRRECRRTRLPGSNSRQESQKPTPSALCEAELASSARSGLPLPRHRMVASGLVLPGSLRCGRRDELAVFGVEVQARAVAEAKEGIGLSCAGIDADEVLHKRLAVAAAVGVHEEVGQAAALVVELVDPGISLEFFPAERG